MNAEYTPRRHDETIAVPERIANVWVEIDGLRIHIMRDGFDDEPLVCVDVWRADDLGVEGGPIQTIMVPAGKKN